MFKCELLIGEKRYNVTDDLKNWDDFELALKRSAYDGVVRSFTTQFEFVKKAYKLLKQEYYAKYLDASVTVIFSLRNNNWEYDEVFRCALDFSTYSEDGLILSINAIDNTLAAIIKSKKNIKYEYPVTELRSKRLKYDGLNLQYGMKYILGASTHESNNVQYINIATNAIAIGYILPLYKMSNSELPPNNSPLLFHDVQGRLYITLEELKANPFLTALSNIQVDLNFKAEVYEIVYNGEIGRMIFLIALNDNNNIVNLWTYEGHGEHRFIDEKISVNLLKGQSLYFIISLRFDNHSGVYQNFDIFFPKFSFEVNFKSRINPVEIDVIEPITVLEKLLDSMTEGVVEHSQAIDYVISGEFPTSAVLNLKLERSYIMAAESARGLPNAKLYTSYKKYCEWMEAVFGYVPVINGNTVTFTYRDKLFSSKVVKELGKQINDYEFTVNDALIYSSVKVGYDKQDYDSINGRDEFRFTNEFSTGITLTDNVLSLISPYRADAYGIEFLVQKRGEDTTDNNSDNDVFFVDCQQPANEADPLTLYRPTYSQISGLLSPETMFNILYSPRLMLKANKKYIGACTNMLKFASSNGNSDVSIDGVKETDDFAIAERLFTVGEVEVSTSDIKSPDNLTGLVRFNNKGEIVIGYIKQLSVNIAKEKAATYTLIVKDIEV